MHFIARVIAKCDQLKLDQTTELLLSTTEKADVHSSRLQSLLSQNEVILRCVPDFMRDLLDRALVLAHVNGQLSPGGYTRMLETIIVSTPHDLIVMLTDVKEAAEAHARYTKRAQDRSAYSQSLSLSAVYGREADEDEDADDAPKRSYANAPKRLKGLRSSYQRSKIEAMTGDTTPAFEGLKFVNPEILVQFDTLSHHEVLVAPEFGRD